MINNILNKYLSLKYKNDRPNNAVLDTDNTFDENNYPYEMVGSFEKVLPKSFIYNDNQFTNQWLQWKTRNWCVFYWEANAINENRWSRWNYNIIDPVEFCDIAEKEWVLDRSIWAYLINWPKLAQKLWYISLFSQVGSLEEIKQALYTTWPVSVWSNKLDFTSIDNFPFVAKYKEVSTWHKFIIVWYDDNKSRLICEDSYWWDRRDKGRFYILYKDYNKLLFPTRTVWHIWDKRIDKIKEYIIEAKEKGFGWFNLEIKKLPDWIEKSLKQIAWQLVYIKKVRSDNLKNIVRLEK